MLDAVLSSKSLTLSLGFSFPPNPFTPEDAVPVMKHAFESGARFWSAAEFYGTPECNSLHLIAAYFRRYPEDASKVIISVKIGLDPVTRQLTTDEAGVRKGYETCAKVLDGVKKIDILSCARIDPEVPVEVSIEALAKLVQEGKVGAVGISECSAASIRRAAKVCKIEAVEVEFSMFTTDILTNGVAEAASEVGAVIAGYSPLGRGVLTGTISGTNSLAEGDLRRQHPRFSEEVLQNNLKLVDETNSVAERVGSTKGQVALAWARAHSGHESMPQILPIPGTTNTKRLDENMKSVDLTTSDVNELNEFIQKHPIIGERYPGAWAKLQWG